MTLDQAKHIIGNRSEWELKHIIRALNMFSHLNDPDDTRRLQAAKIVLKEIRKGRK